MKKRAGDLEPGDTITFIDGSWCAVGTVHLLSDCVSAQVTDADGRTQWLEWFVDREFEVES